MMKCARCEREFDECELELSHDIPKYLGGTDLDGRHWLCKKCHRKYELEVLKVGLMNWIKQLPQVDRLIFKNSAKLVKGYFFKNG